MECVWLGAKEGKRKVASIFGTTTSGRALYEFMAKGVTESEMGIFCH